MTAEIDFPTVIKKFDAILERGLSKGLGDRFGQMCVEAAICAAMDLPHDDKPNCVELYVRKFKISLNDQAWSSPQARAVGLRDLGIAQIGSADTIDGKEFLKRLAEKTIKILIPTLFREIFKDNPDCLEAAKACEDYPSEENCLAAVYVAAADYAAAAASSAAAADYAAAAADYIADAATIAAAADYIVAYTAYASAAAAKAAASDKYLILSANLALEVLKELNSPGVAWI